MVSYSEYSVCILRTPNSELRAPNSELFQEPQIIREEEPDVIDPIFEHGDPLDAHSKCKAGDFLRIIIDKLINCRVDHSRPQDLQPSCIRTDPASFSPADETLDIDFCTGLCERKKTRPETESRLLAEHLSNEDGQDSFLVCKGNPLVDQKSFYL